MTSQPKQFDYVLLRRDAGAKSLASRLSSTQEGKKCAVIEHNWIGGSCPNVACLPSKNFINSANVAYLTRHAHSTAKAAL